MKRGGAISYDSAFCHQLLGVPRWLETFQMGSIFSAVVVLGCLFQGLMGLQDVWGVEPIMFFKAICKYGVLF